MDSDDVVVASSVSGGSCPPSAATSSHLAAGDSTIASTTKVDWERSAGSQVTRSVPFTFAPAFSHSARIRWSALPADPSDRAHTTTGPRWAATAASPHAMAPLPAIPTVSDISLPWLTGQSTA
jgi:hypothetical protein